MSAQVCILCCHNFHAEIAASIVAEGFDDVVAVPFPARCGRPPVSWEELRPSIPADCKQIIILGRSCLHGLGDPPVGFPPVRIVTQKQCFHLVAGEHLVDEAISSGGYLITSAWLADWRGQIRALGFDPEQCSEFFSEFAKELVLLDTGLDSATSQRLAELQAAVGLSAKRISVGLDHTRLLITKLVLEWRLAEARSTAKAQVKRHASELADHVAAIDMLERLAKTQRESEAISSIEELFRMLFAPAALYYLQVENTTSRSGSQIPESLLKAMKELNSDYVWAPDNQGFLLRIAHGDETLGILALEQLAFPQYRERYLNMALSISGVCGLAIDNARNRKRLLEAAKMASLGMLVAGVAHEINTPLGIGLTAASALQNHSRSLTEHFAARSMTQSELTQYLEATATTTRLIRQNLERIGHLVDSFRQLALEGKAPDKTPLRLRACLEDVIISLGDRIQPDRITLQIDCDTELEIGSSRSDWASIFINLISNSLKHGFKDKTAGKIVFAVKCDEKKLTLDYCDDGNGMSPEALSRIFDPFFTTDMQQGMGLGMHLVYNLITQRMGGSIQCESTPRQGVHFHIEIPQENLA